MLRAPAILIVLAASSAQAQDLPVEPTKLRHDEDWSVLREEAVGDGPWWLPAKYQPIDRDGDVWVSTGLEARARYEGFRDNFWGTADVPEGYLWLRVMPHADVHVGPVRGFVQGIAGYVTGLNTDPAPIDETGVDLLQGFAEIEAPFDGGTLTIRGGRELVALGSERLVGARYGTNIPQPFDGVRAIATMREVTVDLFHLRPVRISQSDFDDRSDPARRLRGIYVTMPLDLGQAAGLDAYLLDYQRDASTFEQGMAREDRRTWGVRFHGGAGDWSWNWEAMLQRGSFGGADIRAWSIGTETRRAFPSVPLKPELRLRANVISGDDDPADDTLGTFNPLFPNLKYFGELSPIGPYNIVNIHPGVDLDLRPGLSLGIGGDFYWRQSTRDGVYEVPGQLLRRSGGSRARFIGTQIESVVDWQLAPALSLSASYSIFAAGRFLEETGPAETIHMLGLETRYRF